MANPPNNKPFVTPGVYTSHIMGTPMPTKQGHEFCYACGWEQPARSMVVGPSGIYCSVPCRDKHELYLRQSKYNYTVTAVDFDDPHVKMPAAKAEPVKLKLPMPKRVNTKWGKK